MNPTHISDNENTQEGGNKKNISSTSNIASSLIDIFSQTLEKNYTQKGKHSLEEIYSTSLQQIIAYGKGDIVGPLKKSLGKNKNDTLLYSDVSDIEISLNDIISAFKSISIKSKLLPEHDTVIAKAFLGRIESTIKTFPQEVSDIFKKVIIDNSQYIYSLEYLGKGLNKFFDDCKNAGFELNEDNKQQIYSTTVSFIHIEHESSKTGLVSPENIVASHKEGNIPHKSIQEQLLNTYMTLYGVSKIQSIINDRKHAENRLQSAYEFGGIDALWSGLGISDTMLVDIYPALKIVLEDPDISDADKFIARMKWIGDYLSAQNNPLGGVLTKLSQNGMDFSLLGEADQQIYIDSFKNSWIQSSKGSDLLEYFDSFGVKKEQALRLVDGFFSPVKSKMTLRTNDGEKVNVTIDKKMFTGKSLEENCHLLQTQGLPFSFTLNGELLDENELKKIHTKKDGFYADKIPHALSLIVGAKSIANLSDEEIHTQSNLFQEKLNQHTFAGENVGLHNNITLDEFEEKVDWDDQETILALTQDELQDAKQLYTKHIVGLKPALRQAESDEKSISEELKVVNESLLNSKSLSADDKIQLENKRQTLLKQRGENNATLQDLQEKKADAEQKRKALESIIKAKKKQTSVDPEKDAQSDIPTDIQIPKKELEAPIDYYKEAEAKWNSMQGDKNAPFAVGSSICMDIPDVKGPLLGWKNPWARGEIISIDSDGNFELRITGIDEKLHGKNQDGNPIEGSTIKFYGASGIEEFQGKVGKMWKFGKLTSWKEFGMVLKDKGLELDKEYKDYLGNFLSKVDFSSMYRKNTDGKILDTDENKIKYLGGNVDDLAEGKTPDEGKSVKTQKAWYTVEQHDDGVTISGKDREGNEFSKKMNPQEFIVFITDKQLQTYTQKEVDDINTDRSGKGLNSLQSEIDRSFDIPAKKKRLWTNLKSITHAFKFGLDGVKKWIKDKQSKDDKKLERAMLGSKWFQSLSKLPIIGDAFEDMYIGLDKELDQEKTKEIKEAMEEPEKLGADTGDGPYDYILDPGKFKEVAEGGTLSDEKKIRKLAGYYLYTLSKKGPSPYPKTLAKYAGKGVWVRGLLGPKYQEQYLQYINQLKDNVEKNPNDGESRKLLAQGELGFMKKVYGDGEQPLKDRFNGVFGKQFFAKTLGDYDAEQYDQSEVNKIADKAKTKLFNEAKVDYDKAFGQAKILDMYGSLKGMGENIKADASNYREWMMRLALPILSGVTVNYMDDGLRKDYSVLARQYASPFGLYAKDPDGQKKLWELFGIVSQDSSVGSNFLEYFKEYMPTATEHRPTEEQYPKFLASLNTRWFNHGNKMLDLLSQPGKLIQIKSDLEEKYRTISDSSPEKQETLNKIMSIKHYIDKKVLDEEQEEVEVKLGGVVAERHIMNLGPGAIRRLLTYRNGGFQKDLVENGPKAWRALASQVKSYNPKDGSKASKDLYQFVLKKFVMFFEDKAHFTSTNLKQLLVGLKYSDEPGVIDSYLMDVINPDGKSAPKDVLDAINAFQDFLKIQKPEKEEDMKKILDAVVSPGVGDLYSTIGASGAKDQGKKLINQKRTKAEQAINKREKKNVLIDGDRKISIYKDRDRRYRDEYGNVLTLKKGGNKKGQANDKVMFDISESLNGPVIETLECPNFVDDEIKPGSYEREVLGEDNNNYNQFDGFDGFGGL